MTLALGAHLVLANQLTIGGMVACVVLLTRVFRPVEQFLKNLPDLRRAIGNWKALDAILRVRASPRRGRDRSPGSAGGCRCATSGSPVRTARRLLLDGVGFSVEPGEVVQITGGIGAGKSVLARSLLGQQAIAAGTIIVGGRNIEQFDAEEMCRLVGYLPEDVGFYPGSILDNISRMTPNPRKDDVVAAARRAGAHRMISGLPKGYQTLLDADGSQLSKGQRQKIAMARALFSDPKVLVLDEPATALPGSLSVGSAARAGGPAVVVLGRTARDLPPGCRQLQAGERGADRDTPGCSGIPCPPTARQCHGAPNRERVRAMTSEPNWTHRKPVLIGSAATILLVGAVGAWGTQVRIAGAVVGQGRIEVDATKQSIQHPTGGVIADILVTNGDLVEAGDVVLRLDDLAQRTQLNIVDGELYEVLAKVARLEAEIDERRRPRDRRAARKPHGKRSRNARHHRAAATVARGQFFDAGAEDRACW